MTIENALREIQGKRLIILAGLPGSGKSTIGKKLAKELGALYLSSDEYRERLFESVRMDLAGDEEVSRLSKKAYEEMYVDARVLLSKGKRVILDATHLKPGRKTLVDSMGVDLGEIIFIVVKAKRKNMREWMRRKKGMANEKETYLEAWQRVMGYFDGHFESGRYSYPTQEELGVAVIEYENS